MKRARALIRRHAWLLVALPGSVILNHGLGQIHPALPGVMTGAMIFALGVALLSRRDKQQRDAEPPPDATIRLTVNSEADARNLADAVEQAYRQYQQRRTRGDQP